MIDKKELRRLHSMFNSCSPLFIALGDEVRQKLVLDIVDAGAEGINVKNLSAKSRLSRPAISHHLKVLKDSGLIEPEKVGTQIFYRIDMGLSYLANVVELVSSIQRLLRDSVAAKTAAAGGNQNLA
ncbi:MAG: winged helix-turn-helix transcriptional regulator [Treponema sp.]|nr:winged helix-turn-helix transcriptional regulator [Treponema sp.]